MTIYTAGNIEDDVDSDDDVLRRKVSMNIDNDSDNQSISKDADIDNDCDIDDDLDTKQTHSKRNKSTSKVSFSGFDSEEDDDNEVSGKRSTSSSKSIPPNMLKNLTNNSEISTDKSIQPKKSSKTKESPSKLKIARNMTKDDGIKYNEVQGIVELSLSYPANTRRLLMLQLVEKTTQLTTIRSTRNISNAYAIPFEFKPTEQVILESAAVQTEGVNFAAIWELSEDIVLHNDIRSNDIWNVLQTYGIEAARQSIVNEINAVFGVYGIDVNPRHLSLIADFMTRTGTYHAMNRIGMDENSSALLQMSFETTCNFLLKAAIEGRRDEQESPSARIVLGSVPKVGTGCFDLMIPIQQELEIHDDEIDC